MYAQIIPLRRTPLQLQLLNYIVPEEINNKIKPGQLVNIPFAKQNINGIVFSVTIAPPAKDIKLKPLINIVCNQPIIAPAQLSFFYKLALIYATPLGFILKNSLPSLTKKNLEILINSTPNTARQTTIKLNKKTVSLIYNNLTEKKTILKKLISAEGQTLIILPEIFQINEIINLLGLKYKNKITFISPEPKAKELFTNWLNIRLGNSKIIIGTRKALFFSFNNLQTIIIDDEGNLSHKSWDMAPRFNAKDAAAILANCNNAGLYYLSHTPAVENFLKLEAEGYGNKLCKRTFEIINIKEERISKNFNILSAELANEIINNTLGNTFLYLNKLGSSHYVTCKDCFYVLKCPNCRATYTYYETNNCLRCHRCQKQITFNPRCANCGGVNTAMSGPGINKLCQEVKLLLKNQNREITVIEKSLQASAPIGKPGAIIIGTQYAWSRVNWRSINLFALVDADTSLFVPEYKISEQLWQLLGDANFRLNKNCHKFIQTSYPENNIFSALYNPALFYKEELIQRKMFKLPPYSLLIKVWFEDINEEKTKNAAQALYQKILSLTKNDSNIKILKPYQLFPYHLKGKYSQSILGKLNYNLNDTQILDFIKIIPGSWKVDVNPINIITRN